MIARGKREERVALGTNNKRKSRPERPE